MHDPSFMALALIVSEKITKHKKSTKVYADAAADDNDDDNIGKAIYMFHFCFAGEIKTKQN